MKKKVMLILSCLFLSLGFVVAQTTRVTGVVLDEAGEPVISAAVVVKGTTVGTTTGLDGKFTINVPEGKKVLVFSLIGMIKEEANIALNMKVVLKSDEHVLEDVYVEGYGNVKKTTFTGSEVAIKSNTLKDVTVTSVDKALQGNATGLLTQASSGQPGAGQRIVIRGIGSINAGTEPLWIIDGVPVATGNYGQTTSGSETTYSDNSNALAGINPNDIANVVVLKDASATSIYGSRAANGVILVTTKSGSVGKTKFNLSAQYGWSSRATNKFKVMNQEQYLDYMTDALVNAGEYANKEGALQGLKESFPVDENNNFYNYNWLDKTYSTAPTYNVDFSASGGNDKTKFYVSLGYFNKKGILDASSLDRISNKVNLTHDYSKNLKFGVTSTLSFAKQDTPLTTSSYFANPVLASAILPAVDPGEINGEIADLTFISANYLANIAYNYSKSRSFRLIESAFAEYTLLDDFIFKSQWGVDYLQKNESEWADPKTPGNTASTLGGRGTRVANENLVWNTSNTLSYNKVFNEVHSLGAMIGLEMTNDTYRYSLVEAEGYPSEAFKELGSAATPSTAGSSREDVRLFSVFSSLNYAYENRYTISASFRRDGSSRFSKDNLYANFWSVGGQWRVSQEKFMEGAMNTWLSNLAVRVNYGTTGNSDITTRTSAPYLDGKFPYMGIYRAGYSYNGVSGIRPYQMANPDLKWEQSGMLSAGIDFSVLNGRLGTTLNFYNKKTSDMLLLVPVSGTTGFTDNLQNIGNMRNRGFEWSVNAIPLKFNNFEWRVDFNISFNKNKVLKLYNGEDIINGTKIYREGEDVQSIYTYEWAGVDPDDGAPMWYDKDNNKVKNVNQAERRIVGSRAPKYIGGLTNTLKYKDFDLSFLLYFNQGNKITDQTLQMINSYGSRGLFNQSEDLVNRWRNPGDITDVPKVIYGATTTVYAPMSTHYVYNGSYIRLRNINFGYTIPSHIMKGNTARIYFQATNLLTFTNYKGLDPEVGINGDPWFGYPVDKTIAFGFNYSF